MPPPSAAPASKTTTYGIVARDAPTAVILRRGPTRFTRLLRWDLRDDTVRAGQWLIGRVAPGPCGLSPDGELLIYEARKGTQTFTAVSRPPYFTALAFWEYASPWTGGGFFSANETRTSGATSPRTGAAQCRSTGPLAEHRRRITVGARPMTEPSRSRTPSACACASSGPRRERTGSRTAWPSRAAPPARPRGPTSSACSTGRTAAMTAS